MRSRNIDWGIVKEMRNGDYTWHQIADEVGISYDTLRKRAYKRNMQFKVPYQLGKKICVNCRKYFYRKELKNTRCGLICEVCSVEMSNVR